MWPWRHSFASERRGVRLQTASAQHHLPCYRYQYQYVDTTCRVGCKSSFPTRLSFTILVHFLSVWHVLCLTVRQASGRRVGTSNSRRFRKVLLNLVYSAWFWLSIYRIKAGQVDAYRGVVNESASSETRCAWVLTVNRNPCNGFTFRQAAAFLGIITPASMATLYRSLYICKLSASRARLKPDWANDYDRSGEHPDGLHLDV